MPDTDLDALIHGINGSLTSALAALRYLAEHPRPSGGQSHFNAEHLHQIAREAEKSLAALRARLAPTPHADDEALIEELESAHSCYQHAPDAELKSAQAEYHGAREELRRRLSDLRARAEAAEAKLARAETIVAGLRAALEFNTKEPTDG